MAFSGHYFSFPQHPAIIPGHPFPRLRVAARLDLPLARDYTSGRVPFEGARTSPSDSSEVSPRTESEKPRAGFLIRDILEMETTDTTSEHAESVSSTSSVATGRLPCSLEMHGSERQSAQSRENDSVLITTRHGEQIWPNYTCLTTRSDIAGGWCIILKTVVKLRYTTVASSRQH